MIGSHPYSPSLGFLGCRECGRRVSEHADPGVGDSRAAPPHPDTGVVEEAGPSRTWRLAEGAGLDALPDNACGVMGLCELLKGHEGKHTTSVDRALEGVVLRATHAASPGAFNAPLDVERLARALAASHDEEGVIGALGHGGDPRLGNAAEWGPWAKAYADLAAEVAAAYALAESVGAPALDAIRERLREAIGHGGEDTGIEHWHHATGGRSIPTERDGVFVDRAEVLAIIDRELGNG